MLLNKEIIERNKKLFWNLTQIFVLAVIIVGYGEQSIQPPAKWLEEIENSEDRVVMVANEVQSVDKKVYTLEIENSHKGFKGALTNKVEPLIHFNSNLDDYKDGKSYTQKKN